MVNIIETAVMKKISLFEIKNFPPENQQYSAKNLKKIKLSII